MAMSPRPKNPPPDRRHEILEAALRVFAEKGYSAATNAEIAREAGVTAAALYYYFPSKADMFKAAITERQGVMMPNMEHLAENLWEMPPAMVVPFIVRQMVSFMTEERTEAVLRIVLSEGPRNPEVVQIWMDTALGVMAPILLGYLQHQMELGRIRTLDPRVFAMMTAGSGLLLALTRDLLKIPLTADLSNETLIQNVTELLLAGLAVEKKE